MLHGGYTSQLQERPADLQAAQEMLALITAKPRITYKGAAATARSMMPPTPRVLPSNCSKPAGSSTPASARVQRDGDIRRTAAIMARSAEGMPVSGSIEVVPGVVNPITIAYARFQEARRQPWPAQTACSNVHLCGETSLEYILENEIPIPGMKTGYEATAKRRDEIVAFARQAGQQSAIDSSRHAAVGTVGCVVMDADGRFAAATSTGGTANNVPGRVGDVGTAGGTFASHQGACVNDRRWRRDPQSGHGLRHGQRARFYGPRRRRAVDVPAGTRKARFGRHHLHRPGKGRRPGARTLHRFGAALTFAYSRGDGNVQVFTANPAQYYTTEADLAAAKLGKEYAGFAKSIGSQRETIRIALTPERRKALEQSVERIKNKPENLPVAFLPPRPAKGVPCVPGATDMKEELAKATSRTKEAGSGR